MKGALTSIEAVKEWFVNLGSSKWNLYHGHSTGQSRNATLFARNDNPDLDLEESWTIIERHLLAAQDHGCQFTLRVPDGNNRTGLRALISLNIVPKSQVAGIGGFMSNGGSSLIANDAQYQARLAQRLAHERRMWELEQKVRELEDERAPAGIGEVLMAKLEEVDLDSLIHAVLPMVKFKPPGQVSTVQGIEEGPSAEESPEQKLTRAVNSLRGAVESDQEFLQLLDNFTKMAGENPDLIRMYAKQA